MKLSAHGVHVVLPRGWSGRIFSAEGGAATLHAASFPLALHDGQFGDATTAHMPQGASFLSLTEYLPGAGLDPGRGLFAARKLDLPLEPQAFSSRGLAHPRPGQVGTQQFLTLSGRPFCLYVVLSGERTERRWQLSVLDHLLGTLRVSHRHAA